MLGGRYAGGRRPCLCSLLGRRAAVRIAVLASVLGEVLDERLADRSLTTRRPTQTHLGCPWASVEQINHQARLTDSGRRSLASVCRLEHTGK